MTPIDERIRWAIRDALLETGCFVGVHLTGDPESHGQSAGDTTAAFIDLPAGEGRSIADGGDESFVQEDRRLKVTLMVRHAEAEERDRQLAVLLQCLRNVVNGRSLAGLTVPDHTRLGPFSPSGPRSVERRYTCSVVYQYLAPNWDRSDDLDLNP